MVEAVCEAASRGSTARSMTSALELYEEMKLSGHDKRLADYAKQSKRSGIDFYSALVQCAVRIGKPQMIMNFVANMRETDIPRTCAFYESAMKILAGKKLYKEALAVHNELLQDGLEPSPVTCSCLISFAVEVGDLDKAIFFYEKLAAAGEPSIRAYMTILRVFSKQGNWWRSIEVMKDMYTRGQTPDCLILNIVLATCVAADQLSQAEKLLEETLGVNKKAVDVVSYNTLIKGYAQKGELGKALASLEKMAGHGVSPNSITFNTVMDSAVRCKQPGEAWRVLKVMREAGHVPDKYSCSILVKGLHDGATRDQIQGTLDLLRGMEASDKAEDGRLREVLFHTLLEASASVKDPELVQEVFAQMKQQKVLLNSSGYGTLIKSLGADRQLPLCLKLWDDMLASGTVPHQSVFEAILSTCIDCDELDRGIELLTDIKKTGCGDYLLLTGALLRVLCKTKHTDKAIRIYEEEKAAGRLDEGRALELSTYNMLIRSACDSKHLGAASVMMEDICKAGLKPDEAILNTILIACFKEVRVDLGHKLFTDFAAAGLRMNHATFSTMVKLYGRSQQLQNALDLVDGMEAKFGVAPSVTTYSSLVQACARNKQSAKALEIFNTMKERLGKLPDGPAYGALITCLAGSASHQSQAVVLADEALQNNVDLPDDTIQNMAAMLLRKGGPASALKQLRQFAEVHGAKLPNQLQERLARAGK